MKDYKDENKLKTNGYDKRDFDDTYRPDTAYDEDLFDESYGDDPDMDDLQDESYDDPQYDDKLNRVLDELAELKRSISTPAVLSQTQPQIVQPVSGTLTNGGNEAVMYNEISRLRDELSKTQSNQTLHVELSRLREDMDREKRQNESALLGEIQRLHQKIENIEDVNNAPTVKAETKSVRRTDGSASGELAQLIAVNESILRGLSDRDSAIRAELAALKDGFDGGAFSQLTQAVAAIDKSLNTLQKQIGEPKENELLTRQIRTLSEGLAQAAVGIGDFAPLMKSDLTNGADLTGVSKLLYEVKALIGSPHDDQRKQIQTALAVYDKLESVKEVVYGTSALREKLLQINSFVAELTGDAFVDSDIAKSVRMMIAHCMRSPLSRESYESLKAFAAETDELKLFEDKQEAIRRYLSLKDSLDKEGVVACLSRLSELLEVMNSLQGDILAKQNEALVGEMKALGDMLGAAENGEVKEEIRAHLRRDFARLATLTAGDAATFVPRLPQIVPTGRSEIGSGLAQRLEELKTAVEALAVSDVSSAILDGILDIRARFEKSVGDAILLGCDITDSEGERVETGAIHKDGGDKLAAIREDIAFIRKQIEISLEEDEPVYAPLESETDGKDDQTDEKSTANDGVRRILHELNVVKNKLSGADEYDLMAEILSLREDVKAARLVDVNEVSSELEGLKTELLALKAELAELEGMRAESFVQTTFLPGGENAPTTDEVNMLLSEIVSLRDEIQAYKDDVGRLLENNKGVESQVANVAADEENHTLILDELSSIRSELNGVNAEYLSSLEVSKEEQIVEIEALKDSISEIKDMIARRTTLGERDDETASDELNVVLDEIIDLKNELETVKSVLAHMDEARSEGAPTIAEELQIIKNQLADIQADQIQMQSAKQTADSADIAALKDAVLALAEDLRSRPETASEPDLMVMNEMLSLREELVQMKELLMQPKPQNDEAVLSELLVLRDEMETVRTDVKTLKDEPDLSVISEVMALRDEFQGFKDELYKTRTEDHEGANKEAIINQVQALRDQMFAISMANVNDGATGDVVYESYNNIILDEISALREEVNLLKKAENEQALWEELAQIKQKAALRSVEEKEMLDKRFDGLQKELGTLTRNANDDASKRAIMDELNGLKSAMERQHASETKMLNFLSELTRVLQQQNAAMAQLGTAAKDDDFRIELTRSMGALKAELNQLSESVNGKISK